MSKRSKSKSSFNGKIDEIDGIHIDNFEDLDEKNLRAFFLSHCHTDHMVGLFSEELYQILKTSQDIYIYTTELTSAILMYDQGEKGARLTDYIKVLKEGSQLIVLPKRQGILEEFVTVTTIPAGHCAGATMFLFRTSQKIILYTGDFRIHTNDLSKYQAFHNNGDVISIDKMYIDTTFLNEIYENFPKRSESINNMIFEMKKWLKQEDNAISIFTPARYGYEFVFNKIYEVLQIKVYVNEDRWKLYRNIQNLVPGVTNNPSSRIHLCKFRQQTCNHTACGIDNFQNYLHLYLSAMKWDRHDLNRNSVKYRTPKQLDVCYATHCSRNEILYFVEYLSPKSVVGFPNEFVRNCDDIVDVKRKKVDGNVLKMMLSS